jgi:hypothetical protein
VKPYPKGFSPQECVIGGKADGDKGTIEADIEREQCQYLAQIGSPTYTNPAEVVSDEPVSQIGQVGRKKECAKDGRGK